MKKISLVIGGLALILASCGEPGKAEFDAVAVELCDCMADKGVDSEMADLGFELDLTSLEYSICIKDADVDVQDAQMSASIAEKCPDLIDAHADYLDGI